MRTPIAAAATGTMDVPVRSVDMVNCTAGQHPAVYYFSSYYSCYYNKLEEGAKNASTRI